MSNEKWMVPLDDQHQVTLMAITHTCRRNEPCDCGPDIICTAETKELAAQIAEEHNRLLLMDRKPSKKKLLLRDMVGKKVRLLRELKTNGGLVFKKGRVMVVDGATNGLHLKGLIVRGGSANYIRSVKREDVELVEIL